MEGCQRGGVDEEGVRVEAEDGGQATARTVEVLAACARGVPLGELGGRVVVMVWLVRRKWWLNEVWGRRQRVRMIMAP